MGSGVEATAHLAEVEFRSQGQYRTRIRRTNRSLSAILAAHDVCRTAVCRLRPPPLRKFCGFLNENRKGRRVKHRGWGGGEELG